MPAGGEISHQRTRLPHKPAAKLVAVVSLVALALNEPRPARAGLLTPLLSLMRPQLEGRLTAACQQWAGAGDKLLEEKLAPPCRALAGPTSRCLIEETERSGRSLGVVTELLSGRLGDDSELVIKRCASRMLGLPPESLSDVPIRELSKRLRSAASPALTP